MNKIAINCNGFTKDQKKYVQEAFFRMGYWWSTPGYRHLNACAYAIINGSLAAITECRETTIEKELSNHKFLAFNELMELVGCPWRMMDDGEVVNTRYSPKSEAPSGETRNTNKTYRTKPRNKYDREIVPGVFVDVYDVLGAFKTDSPAVDHAVKKLLAPGKRGHKDRVTDLKEAIASIESEIAKINEWSN